MCRGLGIVKDGEDVTERAMKELADQFKDQVPGTVISALKALFQLDSGRAAEVEDALLEHGGATALDHDGIVGSEVGTGA